MKRGYELVDGKLLKICKEGQERNPKTRRCNKVKIIPRGYELVDGKLLKKCKEQQERNPQTKRCNKINKPKKMTETKLSKSIMVPKIMPKVSPKVSPPRLLLPKPTISKSRSKTQNCNEIGLVWENNSCYLDSLIVSLCHHNNEHVKKILFTSSINNSNVPVLKQKAEQIRHELLKIYNIVADPFHNQEKHTCVSFRKLLNDYQKLYQRAFPSRFIEANDWQHHQAEPIQLLQFLNIIFNFPNTTSIKNKRWGLTEQHPSVKHIQNVKNTPPVTEVENTTSLITMIENNELYGRKYIRIKDYYPIKSDITHYEGSNNWRANNKEYHTKVEQTEFLNAPLLVIHINRLLDMGTEVEKLETAVVPQRKLEFSSGKTLKLSSIIVHWGSSNGGHYVCLYKCAHQWYVYDDMEKKSKHIGTFDKMIQHNNGIFLKNCTDLVYT